MSKRKRDDDFLLLLNKIRKLENKVSRRRRISSSSDEAAAPPAEPPALCELLDDEIEEDPVLADMGTQEWISEDEEDPIQDNKNNEDNVATVPTSEEQPSTSAAGAAGPGAAADTAPPQLDSEVLEILGQDPTTLNKYAPEIHTAIARRFVHIATEGLSKEKRKEFITKYLTPENCVHIGAPGLNPEIKASISESFYKRDKGIETKQIQMASAISCLAGVLSHLLNTENKDKELLSKLMDAGRLLCDIQHGDSMTRRNFISFVLKKEMKEHLVDTKIDKLLFGENLPEVLKSAKAVSKSGTDLKLDQKRPQQASTSRPLNRRAPAPARRPPGPPPRSRRPAAPRAPPARSPRPPRARSPPPRPPRR